MGAGRVADRRSENPGEEQLHWTGLPQPARRVALLVLVVVLALDLSGQLVVVVERSWDSIIQGRILNAWDLAKAAVVAALLVWGARESRSRNLAAFGILFLLIGLEDQVRFHAGAGRVLSRILRSTNLFEGRQALDIGESLALIALAAGGAALVWSWRRPALRSLRRGRLILSILLIALFGLAVVVNYVGNLTRTQWLGIAEEVGERFVLTLTVAYAAGLATVREWWMLP